jgi:SPX domain protein involved in polyphosphate accumulation
MMNAHMPDNPRYEIKFIAPTHKQNQLEQWVRFHHSHFKIAYPDRIINNIYFDTSAYKALEQNISGASVRQKLRYRWYGDSLVPQAGNLELKLKRNCFGWKEIFKAENLLPTKNNHWHSIQRSLKESLTPKGRLLLNENPCPIIVNRYHRKYFISHDQKIRLTLDTNLEVFDQRHRREINITKKSHLPQLFVMEFKANRESQHLLNTTIQSIPIRASKHSKYVTGVLSSDTLR